MIGSSKAAYGNVSCFGVNECLVTDGFNYSQIVSKQASLKVAGSVPFEPVSVSCTVGGTCMAIGDDKDASVLRHGQWELTSSMDSKSSNVPLFGAISCFSDSMCMAVGSDYPNESGPTPGLASLWNGRSWSLAPDASTYDFGGVSCPTVDTCFATASPTKNGAEGELVRWTSGKWKVIDLLKNQSSIGYISCASTTFCVAIEGLSQLVIWNGNRVRLVKDGTELGSGSDGSGSSVDCWLPERCLVVNHKGDVLEVGPNGTVAQQFIDPQLDSASCTTTSFCVAVGLDGLAYRHNF